MIKHIVVFLAMCLFACGDNVPGVDAGPCSMQVSYDTNSTSVDIVTSEPAQWSSICVAKPQSMNFWAARDSIASNPDGNARCLTAEQATTSNLVPGLTYSLSTDEAPETITIDLSDGCGEMLEFKDLHTL